MADKLPEKKPVSKIPKGSGKIVEMVNLADRTIIACEYSILELVKDELFVVAESETEAPTTSPVPQPF